MNREGVAQVPELKSAPDFSLEDELSAAGEFLIEPAPPAPPRTIARGEMESMAMASASPAAAADHEDE